MERWLETDYPSILRRAKRAGAQIFFVDEVGVPLGSSQWHDLGETWRTPVVQNNRCAVRRQPDLGDQRPRRARFMLTNGRVTVAVFIEFLR